MGGRCSLQKSFLVDYTIQVQDFYTPKFKKLALIMVI